MYIVYEEDYCPEEHTIYIIYIYIYQYNIPEFYPRTIVYIPELTIVYIPELTIVYIPELTQSMTTPLGFDDSMTTTHCHSKLQWIVKPSPEGVQNRGCHPSISQSL